MGDVFYFVGIGLTVMALVISFLGLRSERFPASRGIYAAVLGLMTALVVTTCAFAVVLAREEAEHREEEQAHEAEAAAEEEDQAAAGEGEAGAGEPDQEQGGGAAGEDEQVEQEPDAPEPVEVSSPADGGLVFEPDALEAAAGIVEVAYTNPSPVPHNVAIEVDGQTEAESEVVTGGDTASATAELEAGEYVFFCAVPGHREAGMEGTLTVE